MVSEQERMKKMKKMSRVLGINIHQVAAMLEKQERVANGEEEEAPPASEAPASATDKTEKDDPYSKFIREQNGTAGSAEKEGGVSPTKGGGD
ncbi:unnamed protein product, partial [Laminaria digitata]